MITIVINLVLADISICFYELLHGEPWITILRRWSLNYKKNKNIKSENGIFAFSKLKTMQLQKA